MTRKGSHHTVVYRSQDWTLTWPRDQWLALRYEGDATMRVELDLEPAATVNVAQDVLDTVSECLLATSSVVAGRVRAMVEGDMPATEEQRQLAAAFLLDLARDDVAL